MINFGPVSCDTSIYPEDIVLDVRNPLESVMGTLGRKEWELIALEFLQASKEDGYWVGTSQPGRAAERSRYAEMVKAGFLSETKVEEGWIYALTPRAIKRIYAEQQRAKARKDHQEEVVEPPPLHSLRSFLKRFIRKG